MVRSFMWRDWANQHDLTPLLLHSISLRPILRLLLPPLPIILILIRDPRLNRIIRVRLPQHLSRKLQDRADFSAGFP